MFCGEAHAGRLPPYHRSSCSHHLVIGQLECGWILFRKKKKKIPELSAQEHRPQSLGGWPQWGTLCPQAATHGPPTRRSPSLPSASFTPQPVPSPQCPLGSPLPWAIHATGRAGILTCLPPHGHSHCLLVMQLNSAPTQRRAGPQAEFPEHILCISEKTPKASDQLWHLISMRLFPREGPSAGPEKPPASPTPKISHRSGAPGARPAPCLRLPVSCRPAHMPP